jgi:chromate transporter
MVHRLWELARLFLKLGATSFGGPAVYIAQMEREAVERRGWLSREQFLDLIGITYLFPGPNAVQMANHLGFRRAGILGCLLAGAAFTLPGAVISGALAWCYLAFGSLQQVEPFLLGVKPIVVGIIFAALCRLGKSGLRGWQLLAIGAAVTVASLAGCDAVLTLLAGGLIGTLLLRWTRRGARPPTEISAGAAAAAAVLGGASSSQAAQAVVATAGAVTIAMIPAVPLWKLGLFFLKVGAVLYGGGYVLVAYLEGGLVQDHGWLSQQQVLSQQQLLDAVAIGQITPGPLLSTVTFVGYLVTRSPVGALIATVAVLLPSFFFVAAAQPFIPKLRRWRWAGLFLDAVTAASIGLMAAVTITLGGGTLADWPSWLLAIAAAAVSLRWNTAPLWLVLAGAAAGRLLW